MLGFLFSHLIGTSTVLVLVAILAVVLVFGPAGALALAKEIKALVDTPTGHKVLGLLLLAFLGFMVGRALWDSIEARGMAAQKQLDAKIIAGKDAQITTLTAQVSAAATKLNQITQDTQNAKAVAQAQKDAATTAAPVVAAAVKAALDRSAAYDKREAQSRKTIDCNTLLNLDLSKVCPGL